MSRRIATDRDQRNAQQLLDKVRRTASDNDHYDVLYHQPEGCSTRAVPGHGSLNLAVVRKNVETLEGLRQLVVGLVKLRLQAEYIKHPSDTHMHMSWCLPQALPDQPFWRLLLEDPLSLTKEMLETLILLHEWNADSPKVDPNSAVNRLYIRTLEVPVALLKGILNDMSEQGYNTLERVHYWQQRIEEEMDDETIFTLRYCGQTKDSPWVRHTSDMYSSIETFFGRFMLSLGQSEEGRKVLRAIKVHSVAGAIETVSREQADLREQILIAMFRDCSLNTQAGGKDVITLYNEDRRNFELLQSQTIALLYSQTRSCTAAETEDIRKYASDVRRYVDKNPSTTKNKAFNEHTEAMIRDQGTPSMLPNGSAVMVTVASDLGEGHDSSEDSFWEAGGRSAEAVGYIYNHFASWEGPTALESVDPQKFKQLARDGYLPLVDRWPWYSKEDKDSAKASELLGRYMNAVRPMIVFTYGEEQLFAAQCNFGLTNAQTFASWKKACRTPGVALPRGVPYLGHFDGKDSDNNPESATVIIPSFHPGFLSRGGIVKDKATRVFVLTAAVAWCAMSCALQIAS
ncbi:hypothetical protein C7974DRAFT_149749 [Boeremia exigua]|uniref:uncharacterized protein n=1 Tax=Boeremia exigua TaxID=749465 RepID=UPI001E8CDE5C|nr:uncharacterized protein C7974DRAFT_149749 [Boeremia exigua]KAH6637892.1 hypothetical protein C7974DRAFT_149749 [Boeremia exigua]